jgi:hypothetical protein
MHRETANVKRERKPDYLSSKLLAGPLSFDAGQLRDLP